MRIIFGIGNPGTRYEFTRHNAGFLLLDHFAKINITSFKEAKGEYLQASGKIAGQDFSLIKPTTYVNNSGAAAKQILENYLISPENILVVCDDSNLKTGTIRVRLSGSDGGHNGLSSIIYHLATEDFPRIRLGIGPISGDEDLANYVLSDFSKNELEELKSTFKNASSLIEEFIIDGAKKMLEANSRLVKDEQPKNLQIDDINSKDF